MLHLCHIFLGPPFVDGHWGLFRVLPMANSAAVSMAAYGPLDPSEVCPLRACTREGGVLGHMGALLGPHEISATPIPP